MNCSLIKVSPTASACALGNTPAHQLPAREASAGDIALLEQEEAEKMVRHFSSVSLLALHWNWPGQSLQFSLDTR